MSNLLIQLRELPLPKILKLYTFLFSSLILLCISCGKTEAHKRTHDRIEPKTPESSNGTKEPEDTIKTPQKPTSPADSTLGSIDQETIFKIVSESDLVKYRWKNRGKAPIGYLKGMGLVYAKNVCKLNNNDPFALEISKPSNGDKNKDALAHYASQFDEIGLPINSDRLETLRQLFILQIGLGMRESSGKFCTGRDTSASNTNAETAEAGLFQTSYNARASSKLLTELFNKSRATPEELQNVFKEGTSCTSISDNHGTGDGVEFQQLSKSNPLFATEFTAIAIRNLRKHWGPINRREVELKLEANDMLLEIQNLLEATNPCNSEE